LVSDIPAGDGNVANPFFTVYALLYEKPRLMSVIQDLLEQRPNSCDAYLFILMDLLRFNHSPKALYSRGLTSPVNSISVLLIAVNTLENSKMSRVLSFGPRQVKLVGKTISDNLMLFTFYRCEVVLCFSGICLVISSD
jgi:hypothetical protein